MEEHGSHWNDFREILHEVVLLKYIEKFQVWLKLDNLSSTLLVDSSFLITTSPQNIPKTKKKKKNSERNCRENKITHFMSTHFYENRAVYEKKIRIES